MVLFCPSFQSREFCSKSVCSFWGPDWSKSSGRQEKLSYYKYFKQKESKKYLCGVHNDGYPIYPYMHQPTTIPISAPALSSDCFRSAKARLDRNGKFLESVLGTLFNFAAEALG